jgi:PTS system nitrogen regulatory IIA component
MELADAAEFLHVSVQDLERLVQRRHVPYHLQGGRYTFRRQELHDWASRRILGAKGEELGEIHRVATQMRPPPDRHEAFLSQFLMPEAISTNLQANTRSSILRELVKLAARTNLVCDEKLLLQFLNEREEMCPTGMPGGLAIPHPRVHADYLIIDSFLVVAYVPGGVPFGSPDGQFSDLFFVPCTQDDRTHLYMLARLARLLQATALADALRDCTTADDVISTFHVIESEFVAQHIR